MVEGWKVLIVEDSPSQAAAISSIVETLGHTPAVVGDLSKGIAQVMLKEQPNLVLLDLMLLNEDGKPIADGFQICREIKRNDSSTAVIVVSAEEDDDACDWAMMQGADAFLQKPFEPRELAEVMSAVMLRDQGNG